jgi:hypothetical protein
MDKIGVTKRRVMSLREAIRLMGEMNEAIEIHGGRWLK